MSLEARKAHDAEIMRLKQAKKLEEAAAKAAEVAAKAAAAKKWLVLMSEISKKSQLHNNGLLVFNFVNPP